MDYAREQRVKMVLEGLPDEVYYGRFLCDAETPGYCYVAWDHNPTGDVDDYHNFVLKSRLMPDDQPNEIETWILVYKIQALEDELDSLRVRLRKACEHKNPWGKVCHICDKPHTE